MAQIDDNNTHKPAKKRNTTIGLLKRTMIYLIAVYLVWLCIGCTIQRSILFPRSMIEVPAVPNAGPEVQILHIDSPQGPVEGWFIPGKGVNEQTPGPLVIFAHGNGELIDHWPWMLSDYTEMGISVLLPEFRGYGRSAGDPSQKAIQQDYTAFYDLAVERPDVDASRIVLHGRSIGGAVVIQLAKDRPPKAMILQSAPASVRRIASRFLVPWFLVSDPYFGMPIIEKYNGPILVMHGKQDRIVPSSHGQRLADAAIHHKSRLILYDADHNTVPPSETYWQDIEQFLKDAGIFD